MFLKSFLELREILNEINLVYTKICKDWDTSIYNSVSYNQSNITVKNIYNDADKKKVLLAYRLFLVTEKQNELLKFSLNPMIYQYRIKQLNSIYSKLNYYVKGKKVNGENGTVSVNKCFNDIFGLRIITDIYFDFEDLKNFLTNYFPKFKCINKFNYGAYRAIHIYIKQDNTHYLWELQLWHKDDVENNYKSHKKHKEEYTEWEGMYKEAEKEVEND